MIGPKMRPTLPVPRNCIANSTMMTTAEIGRTYGAAFGVAISRPSIADSTEMAGVMMPSPKNRQAPAMPIRDRMRRRLEPADTRWASAMSARMPPSPRLSARMTRSTYFTVTIRINDQKISDRMPMISVSVIGKPWKSCRLVLNAYSGLVPISP